MCGESSPIARTEGKGRAFPSHYPFLLNVNLFLQKLWKIPEWLHPRARSPEGRGRRTRHRRKNGTAAARKWRAVVWWLVVAAEMGHGDKQQQMMTTTTSPRGRYSLSNMAALNCPHRCGVNPSRKAVIGGWTTNDTLLAKQQPPEGKYFAGALLGLALKPIAQSFAPEGRWA
uniref:Uncharacterized protein n=1 Tax=Globodera rostochiensis TaxID=31243 RepID=A0A914I7C4_GLORO